ncbi:hypothetical protein Tco_0759162 [Tanacetum coccineum]
MMMWCWLRWRRGDEIGECDVKWRDEVVSGGAWRWGSAVWLAVLLFCVWFRGDVNDWCDATGVVATEGAERDGGAWRRVSRGDSDRFGVMGRLYLGFAEKSAGKDFSALELWSCVAGGWPPRGGSSGVEMVVWCWLRWRRGDEVGECDVEWRDEVGSGGAWRWGGCGGFVVMLMMRCGGAWDGDDDDGGGRLWLPEEGWQRRWRCMAASECGDRTDRVMGSVLGFGRKSPSENFSGGGGVVAGGWPKMGRERGEGVIVEVSNESLSEQRSKHRIYAIDMSE